MSIRASVYVYVGVFVCMCVDGRGRGEGGCRAIVQSKINSSEGGGLNYTHTKCYGMLKF